MENWPLKGLDSDMKEELFCFKYSSPDIKLANLGQIYSEKYRELSTNIPNILMPHIDSGKYNIYRLQNGLL